MHPPNISYNINNSHFYSTGEMKDTNSSAKSKSAITEISSAKNKTHDDIKSKNNIAPIAEFDKSPPSTLEEVLTVGDPTPPTEAIDDLVSGQYSPHDKSHQSKKWV